MNTSVAISVQTNTSTQPSINKASPDLSFIFGNNPIRIQQDESGNVWFCGSDICDVLGYANRRQAIIKNCKEKGVSNRDTLTKGGSQSITYINESNLYRLIAKSRKPQAETFEEWIFEDVLPTIRKTGSYSMGQSNQNKTINPKQYQELRLLLDQAAACTGHSYKPTYARLLDYFKVRYNVNKLTELPISCFEPALELARGKLELMEKWRDEQRAQETEFVCKELVEGVPSLTSLKRHHQSEFIDGMPDQDGWVRIWKSERKKKAKEKGSQNILPAGDDTEEALAMFRQLDCNDQALVIKLFAELRGDK